MISNMMRLAVAFLLMLVGARSAAAAPGNVDLPRYPAISPDGTTIVFSWRGDLWSAPVTGGSAIRLTSHAGDDLRAAFSPDGSRIAFESDRSGFNNIHLMNSDGTNVRQLTESDRPLMLNHFGVDDQSAEVVTFHAYMEGDTYREFRPYMVSTDGGEIRRMFEAFGSFPFVSPDGSRVVFQRGGFYGGYRDAWARRHYDGPEAMDVWIFERAGRTFRRLTSSPGNDGAARWGGDRTLLYLSSREMGCVNLWRMSAEEGETVSARLTDFTERDVQWFDVAPEVNLAVLAVWDTLYTLDLVDPNSEPVPLTIIASEDDKDNYTLKKINRSVSDAALSPDGQVMAVVAYGEVYVRNTDDDSVPRRVTFGHARERDIAWSPDGLKLYFTSDRDGTDSIYAATVTLTRGEVKEEFDKATGRTKDEADEEDADDEAEEDESEDEPDENGGADGDGAADDPISGVWQGSADVPDMGVMPYSVTLELATNNAVTGSMDAGPYSGPLEGTYDPGSGALQFSVSTSLGMALDFNVTVEDGQMTGTVSGDGVELVVDLTRTASDAAGDDDDDEDTGKDAKKKKKDLPKELQPDRWHDAMKFAIEPVVQRQTNDRAPSPSLDGKHLAFRSVRGDVDILDLESGETRNLITGWDSGISWAWSPDSRHIAYAQSDLNFNDDVFIVPADGSAPPVNITRHPDSDYVPRWSADGKILSFVSERINEENDLWMVYLDKDLEALTPQELKKYYEDAAKAVKKRKPLEIEPPDDPEDEEDGSDDADDAEDEQEEGGDDGEAEADNDNEEDEAEDADEEEDEPEPLDLDDAYRRVRRVTSINGNEFGAITPGGDRFVFTSSGDNPGLYSIKWDGSDKKRLAGIVNMQEFSLTGDKLVVVSAGQGGTVAPGGGSVEFVTIADEIRIDLQEQAGQKFLEAARRLGEEFYHPTMRDLDWAKLTADYYQLARQTRTPSEFNYVANRFLGELNASHLGAYMDQDQSPNAQSNGRLGIGYRRVDDGYEVTVILPQGPAEKGPMKLEVGDVITAVELEPFSPTDTLPIRLKGRVNDETLFSIRRTMEDGQAKDLDILLTPIGYNRVRRLAYDAWREDNRRLVEEWTDGRLGYIHIESMGQASLDVFERDLFAAANGKDGLVIDVRNNGGGWTTDRVLASIMALPHAYTIPRGADPNATGHYPQDRLFIQRYTMPMNLLCNEKSFSNAEIMAHAFKTLHRGTLIGQQTYGGVISTGGFALIDGTFVRLPFRGWYVADGTNRDMELNGAMPDIVVEQLPEHEATGRDMQLRAAVDDLLQRLDESQ